MVSGVLEGIRILDCTIWQQGPVATTMLGDLGADVIKIEDPIRGDPGRGMQRLLGLDTTLPGGRNLYFEGQNRNKRGITLDMKNEAGRQVLYRLVGRSDVFVQNFRRGVADRLGVSYHDLVQYNPKLIYASASGLGPKGPEADRPVTDNTAVARSGIMTAMGEPDLPPLRPMGGLADQMGAIILAYAILAAIIARERFGVGQEVDVSLLGGVTALQSLSLMSVLVLGKELPRISRAKAANPLSNHYFCADGKGIAFGMLQGDRYWPDFCKALGREDLRDNPLFRDAKARAENAEEIVAILDKIFATKTSDEWLRLFDEAGDFVCAPVNSISDVCSDPQMLENDYIVDFDHPSMGKVKLPGIPFSLSVTPGSVRRAAPQFGEHTEEVLIEVGGYTWDEIARLREQGVI
jgi:CoA:oxalate CoA-transferase